MGVIIIQCPRFLLSFQKDVFEWAGQLHTKNFSLIIHKKYFMYNLAFAYNSSTHKFLRLEKRRKYNIQTYPSDAPVTPWSKTLITIKKCKAPWRLPSCKVWKILTTVVMVKQTLLFCYKQTPHRKNTLHNPSHTSFFFLQAKNISFSITQLYLQ